MTTTRLPSLFAPESRLFDEAFREFMRPWRWEPTLETPQIAIDVMEAEDAYTVTAMLPGVKKEDIHVEIEGRQVMVTTEFKKPEPGKKDSRVVRGELSWGVATRAFALGCEVDRAKASARYVDGVLTLTLPKFVPAHSEPLIIE